METRYREVIPVGLSVKAYSKPLFIAEKRLRDQRKQTTKKSYGCWSVLAERLMVPYSTLLKVSRFRDAPSQEYIDRIWPHWEAELLIITGQLWEQRDVFPRLSPGDMKLLAEEQRIFADVSPVSLRELADAGAIPALPPAPDKQVLKSELKSTIGKVLNTLTPREKDVMVMRYGLDDDGREYTMAEIGRRFNVSIERIRQIENHVLRKLRWEGRADRLRPFLSLIR